MAPITPKGDASTANAFHSRPCLMKDRGASYVQASQDLNVHPAQLREGEEVLRGSAARLPWPRRPEVGTARVSRRAAIPGNGAWKYKPTNLMNSFRRLSLLYKSFNDF